LISQAAPKTKNINRGELIMRNSVRKAEEMLLSKKQIIILARVLKENNITSNKKGLNRKLRNLAKFIEQRRGLNF
jgi:hypothetical protein